MHQDNYNVVVLLLTHNCLNTIDRSIQSVLDQSFDSKRIKIVVVDNNSTDGTYEKLIKYTKEYNIGVYRLRKKYLPTRLLLFALNMLTYVEFRYLTILCPGDKLFSNYVKKCSAIMDKTLNLGVRVLICETDLTDEYGNISNQTPLFSENCILKKEHLTQFFTNGIGHKIQAFYSNGTIPKVLSELSFYVDYTDWFKKAFFLFRTECVYIKDALSSIASTFVTKYDDKLYELILRLNLVIKFKIYRTLFPGEDSKYLDGLNFQKIHENLSLLALQYASDELAKTDTKMANKILLFAEILNEEIINTEFYAMLKNSIATGRLIESTDKYKITENSVFPPDGAIIISSTEDNCV